MNRIIYFFIISLTLISCQDESETIPFIANPFENISYEVIREREGLLFANNYYHEDTIGIQIVFSEPLETLDSVYLINTFEPNIKSEIHVAQDDLIFSINYPIAIDYSYDSIELVAVLVSNEILNIPIIKEKIDELELSSTLELYNINSDLPNGFYSDYFDSFKIKGRDLNKSFLSEPSTGALDIFLMNFNDPLQEESFQYSFKSFAKSEFNTEVSELLNGTKFVKLVDQTIDDFHTPSQIVDAFDSQAESASYEIKDVEIGDLYAVRIHDNNSGKKYDAVNESFYESHPIDPKYDLPYAILEVVGIYDDQNTASQGGSDDDYISFRLLTFNPPRASPFLILE